MHIEVRDQSLVERLKRLLPRPDAPYDDVIRLLLEQPCKLKLIDVARTAIEELANDWRFRENLAKAVGDVVVWRLSAFSSSLYKGGWDAVIDQALKMPDKCLTFSEIRKYYGKNLNSVMLRRRGFVRKKRGVWCYPEDERGGGKPGK